MTIEEFKLDFSEELREHYLGLEDFKTIEEYIAECCNGATILDFAEVYGAKTTKDLIKYYEKGYHKTINVEPITLECKQGEVPVIAQAVFKEDIFIDIKLESQLVHLLIFSLAKPKELLKPQLNRYEAALRSAKLFELLLLEKISLKDYISLIDELNPKCRYGEILYRDTTTGLVVLIESVNNGRFEELLGCGQHSYWHKLSFTDFQDDNGSDPSEEECRRIEIEIGLIEDRIDALSEYKNEEVSQLWNDALYYAKLIEKVWWKEVSVKEFIQEIHEKEPRHALHLHIQEDPDRPGNMITKGSRFSSLINGSNSLWEYLTDTDFDLGDHIVIPSEEKIKSINVEIQDVRRRLIHR